MALASATQEALWWRNFEMELNPKMEVSPTILHGDNIGALQLAKNGGYHPRTKHIDIRHHFINQHIDNGAIKLEYIPTGEMAADGFTKPVKDVQKIRKQLNLQIPHNSYQRGVLKNDIN